MAYRKKTGRTGQLRHVPKQETLEMPEWVDASPGILLVTTVDLGVDSESHEIPVTFEQRYVNDDTIRKGSSVIYLGQQRISLRKRHGSAIRPGDAVVRKLALTFLVGSLRIVIDPANLRVPGDQE